MALYLSYWIRCILSTILLLTVPPLYFLIFLMYKFASLFLGRKFFQMVDDFCYAMYQKLILIFFEYFSGVKVILYGDVDKCLKKKENTILISNHQCTVDWIIADILGERQGSIGNIRYILKDSLKYIPLYGFYFREHSSIYVKRSGNFDKSKAAQQLDLLASDNIPFWMVIFPEGHRYNVTNLEELNKNKEFAKDNGMPVYDHLLTPRVKAFELCLTHLRKHIDCVYDITVAYSQTLGPKGKRMSAPTLFEFYNGDGQRLHIHIKRIPISDIPCSTTQLESWLFQRYKVKDEMLKNFFEAPESNFGKLVENEGYHDALNFWSLFQAFVFWLIIVFIAFNYVFSLKFYIIWYILAAIFTVIYSYFCV